MIDVIGLIQTLESEEEREYFTKLYDEYAARVKKAVKRYIYNDSDAESVQKLQEAIKILPLEHQDIIKLKFEEELTNVQIAGILGMIASTVGTILNRSMTNLRKILEEYYHD